MSLLRAFFSSDGFMPHGHCYLWDGRILWLNVLSDAFIALAYFSIPISLLIFVRRRKDLEFSSLYLSFALFIVSCGFTHLCEVLTVWIPVYRLQAAIKCVTAVASMVTAVLLVRVLPRLLRFPSPRDLRKANQELQRANQELEAFSYSVSHDLRAPLRAIDGFSKLLVKRNTSLDPDSARMLGLVRSETQRMNQLIEDLLEFSRVVRKPMNCVEVDMEALATAAFQECRAMEPDRQVELKMRPLPKVIGEAGMLRQAWVNLISNAIKFSRSREKAVVEISSSQEDGEVVFSVADNGVGFNMEYAHNLFGVFQRLHTQQEFEGTGVGLALVQRIVQRHGGRIWAQAELEKGATFRFSLPLAEASS